MTGPCESGCALGLGDACAARVRRVPRYCELVAEGHPGMAEAVRRESAAGPPTSGPPTPQATPGPCIPCRQAKPRVNLAEAVAITRAARAPEPPPDVAPATAEYVEKNVEKYVEAPGERCVTCPISDLPACAGTHEPGTCSAVATGHLRRKSIFYSSVHHGWPRRPPPPPPPPPAGRVVIRAGLDGFSGYGQAVAAIGDELTAAGVPVAFRPIGKPSPDFVTTPTATLARADAGAPEPHELLVALPNQALDPARRTTVLSMWEASRIPPDWAAKLNAAARVVVPCAWNRDGFRASGVTAPVDVIPLGVDLAVFRPGRPRDPAAPFTVGCAGRTAHGGVRKGLDDVIAAFLAAFPGDPGVRLRVKCWADCKVNDPGDPRVSIEREPLTAGALAGWYRSLDAFASASRSEGFGLMPLQALASGVPVIATAYGGHAEYLDGRVGYPVGWDEEPAVGLYGGMGTWARPRMGGLVARLREARDDPARRAKGIEARARALGFPWSRTARGLRRSLGAAGTHADPGPSLGAALIVRDGAILDRAVGSIRADVDRLVVGVDHRADEGVREWLHAQGIEWFPFRFDGFGASYNRAAAAVGTDWVLSLDADETIDPAGLRALCARGEAEGVDAWTLPRRHWRDLERNVEHPDPWPDRQAKLRRRGVGFRWEAHQEVAPGWRVRDADGPVIEHYNFALRTGADWARVNAEYAGQLRRDIAAGRVWTGDPGAVG